MAEGFEALDDDFWGTAFAPGTSSTWTFEGEQGLARLSGPVRLSATPAAGFRSRLSLVQLDHVSIEASETSPHTSSRTAAEIAAYPVPALSIVLLLEGRARIEVPGASFALEAGQGVALDSRDPLEYTSSTDTKMLRVAIGLEHVPAVLRRRGATLPGPLRRTPSVDSYVAFVSSVLSTTAAGRAARGDRLVQVVVDLQSAVLAEAQQLRLPSAGPVRLRHLMEDHIELHHADPGLDPQRVAAAFGVSLRQAHAAFEDGEGTLARTIRARRVDAVALELRASADAVRLADLARRHGFRSASTLARAFEQRFGTSPGRYRDAPDRGLARDGAAD